ncbi:ABC transporter permease [Ferruginibacter sp.]
MFKNYFKTAVRNLKRNKGYAFINIMGLSLGLAAAMLILLYVKDEVSYDRFHAETKQLYRIVNKNVRGDSTVENINGFSGYFQGPKFAAGIPEIKHYVRYRQNQFDLKMGTDIQPQEVYEADTAFFSAFSFPLLKGNPKTALQQPNGIVISEKVARAKFGTTDALGKIMLLKKDDDFVPFEVTGVSKTCPQNSSIKFDAMIAFTMSNEEAANQENWFNFFLNTFVVLQKGANIATVEQKMKQIYAADAGPTEKILAEKYDVKTKAVYFLQPFVDMHLSTELSASNGLQDASNPVYSYILTGIAVFILLIACINFVNLTIARSVRRAKEIGIRKVVGGQRKGLIMQFLGESSILCFIAFMLALVMVQLVLPVFNDLSNKALALNYLFDAKLVAGYALLFVVTSFLAGFYPALILSGYNPVETLYSRFVLSGKSYLQKSLVVLQFALASFLIMATLTIFSQFNFLTSQDKGYDDSNIVMVEKWEMSRADAKLLKEELMKNPSIIGVAPKNGGSWGTGAKVNGDMQMEFAYEIIDTAYLRMMKIPVVKGRNFSAEFPSDSTRSVLVNETFAREAGWKDPIGQVVNFWYNEGGEVYGGGGGEGLSL